MDRVARPLLSPLRRTKQIMHPSTWYNSALTATVQGRGANRAFAGGQIQQYVALVHRNHPFVPIHAEYSLATTKHTYRNISDTKHGHKTKPLVTAPPAPPRHPTQITANSRTGDAKMSSTMWEMTKVDRPRQNFERHALPRVPVGTVRSEGCR